MNAEPRTVGILLVDDGELDGVARVLEQQGLPFTRLRGGQIPSEVAPPRDLLIVTPRRVERVRRGSPPDAPPGSPQRIIAVDEDSPAMRRRLRRLGLNLLVRLPAEDEIWRLLVSRALYRGGERREGRRVMVCAPVDVGNHAETEAPTNVGSQAETSPPTEMGSHGETAPPTAMAMPTKTVTTLLDLSNRGCRLRTSSSIAIGDLLEIAIPTASDDGSTSSKPLILQGHVRRRTRDPRSDTCSVAVVFVSDLPESTRVQLTSLINRWASGPSSMGIASTSSAPTIPTCRMPTLPELTLDDETDPPVQARSEVQVVLSKPRPQPAHSMDAATPPAPEASDRAATGRNRRRRPRGRFEAPLLAETPTGPVVMLGADLSPAGMRIERIEEFQLGDRFRLALHGPGPTEPFIVDAEVVRDDGANGFALAFHGVDPETAIALEKLVACLPDVESLEDGEVEGLGTVLSEILGV